MSRRPPEKRDEITRALLEGGFKRIGQDVLTLNTIDEAFSAELVEMNSHSKEITLGDEQITAVATDWRAHTARLGRLVLVLQALRDAEKTGRDLGKSFDKYKGMREIIQAEVDQTAANLMGNPMEHMFAARMERVLTDTVGLTYDSTERVGTILLRLVEKSRANTQSATFLEDVKFIQFLLLESRAMQAAYILMGQEIGDEYSHFHKIFTSLPVLENLEQQIILAFQDQKYPKLELFDQAAAPVKEYLLRFYDALITAVIHKEHRWHQQAMEFLKTMSREVFETDDGLNFEQSLQARTVYNIHNNPYDFPFVETMSLVHQLAGETANRFLISLDLHLMSILAEIGDHVGTVQDMRGRIFPQARAQELNSGEDTARIIEHCAFLRRSISLQSNLLSISSHNTEMNQILCLHGNSAHIEIESTRGGKNKTELVVHLLLNNESQQRGKKCFFRFVVTVNDKEVKVNIPLLDGKKLNDTDRAFALRFTATSLQCTVKQLEFDMQKQAEEKKSKVTPLDKPTEPEQPKFPDTIKNLINLDVQPRNFDELNVSTEISKKLTGLVKPSSSEVQMLRVLENFMLSFNTEEEKRVKKLRQSHVLSLPSGEVLQRIPVKGFFVYVINSGVVVDIVGEVQECQTDFIEQLEEKVRTAASK